MVAPSASVPAVEEAVISAPFKPFPMAFTVTLPPLRVKVPVPSETNEATPPAVPEVLVPLFRVRVVSVLVKLFRLNVPSACKVMAWEVKALLMPEVSVPLFTVKPPDNEVAALSVNVPLPLSANPPVPVTALTLEVSVPAL